MQNVCMHILLSDLGTADDSRFQLTAAYLKSRKPVMEYLSDEIFGTRDQVQKGRIYIMYVEIKYSRSNVSHVLL